MTVIDGALNLLQFVCQFAVIPVRSHRNVMSNRLHVEKTHLEKKERIYKKKYIYIYTLYVYLQSA